MAARPDIFFTGHDGSMRSNRTLCQLAGQYGVDMFVGSTLQVDGLGNSSTVTHGRLSGFGGAPNISPCLIHHQNSERFLPIHIR